MQENGCIAVHHLLTAKAYYNANLPPSPYSDSERLTCACLFRMAPCVACRRMVASRRTSKPGRPVSVLDLGAGSGLLSMMAARSVCGACGVLNLYCLVVPSGSVMLRYSTAREKTLGTGARLRR